MNYWKYQRCIYLTGPVDLYIADLWVKVVDALNLSYHTVRQLNEIINTKLPRHPHFECKELDIGSEHLDFYCRDILEYI
jgi:hypothetical protein